MIEDWKDIIGYEGLYQISNFGNVKTLKYNKSKLLKGAVNNYGYRQVNLSRDGVVKSFKIHQLVATHFLNHVVNGYQKVINHIDFDRLNNVVSNLEIVSPRENTNKNLCTIFFILRIICRNCLSRYTNYLCNFFIWYSFFSKFYSYFAFFRQLLS